MAIYVRAGFLLFKIENINMPGLRNFKHLSNGTAQFDSSFPIQQERPAAIGERSLIYCNCCILYCPRMYTFSFSTWSQREPHFDHVSNAPN